MVSLLSFFSGKRKSRRAPSSPPADALTPGKQTANDRPSSPRKAGRRFLSLRRKPTPRRPADIASRRASSDITRRKSTKRASKDGLPKLALGWEHGSTTGDILGLEGLGRPPRLKVEEQEVLDGIRWSLDDVAKGWDRIGQALMDIGLDTPGIFIPRRLPSDTDNQQRLLALFTLSVNPALATSFPSLTSHYNPSSSSDSANTAETWNDRLRAAIADTTHPADLAENLKIISRRQAVAPVDSGLVALDVGLYTSFLRAEQLAGFPPDSYDQLFVPRITPDVKAYLDNVFRIWAAIAAHANANELTRGKLCRFLGWWIWGQRAKADDWRTLYEGWVDAGRRIEHIFLAWIRGQSVKQKLPTRLLQLVEHYPYGEVRPDADSLTLPPSSIARRGLHLVLASETPLPDVVTPYTAIQAALRATIAREDSPSWAALQGGSSDRQIETLLDDDSSSFMRLFHNAKGDPDSQGAQTKAKASEFSDSIAEEPLYRPFLTTVDGQHARRRSRSSGDLLLTVPLLGAIDASSPSSHAPGKTSPGDSPPSRLVKQYSSGTLRPSPKTADTWDNFKFAGFGEGERESFELSPAIAQAALRPSQSSRVVSFGSDTSDRPPAAPHQGKGTFVVAQEGIIEIDDHFFLFVHDGQLDKVTLACWPSFALVRLRNPIPHANGDIECVLITLEHRPPARSFSPIPNSIERSASPAESTASRSLSFFRRSSSFGPRRSLFGPKPAPKTSASAYPLPVLAESGSSTPVGKEPLSAISAAPTEYTITEMGEMVKIAANKSPAAAPGSNDLPTIAAVLDPTHDTKASEWAYWAEGGGHLIFKYKGSHSAYSRQVLRLRKPTSPLSAHQEVATHWKETLLPKLLPAQLLLTSTPVKLNHQWARELLEGAEQVRPESRKLDSGNLAAAITGDMMGSLMDDTTAAGVDTETIFSVEIKPKWGFVPQANNISPPEAAGIKSKHSRYVLHRHYKREGLDDTFDPLDLFASDQARVQQALDGLWSIWKDTAGAKNNWRVYVNGKPIMPDQIDLLPGSADDSLVNRTAPFLLPALQASNVLPKLRDLQSSLDPVDISTLAQRFRDEHPDEKLFDPTIIAEPTIPELDTVVEKYCANPAGHSGWTLREQMIAYALSAIFKDCSIFVTIPLKQHGNKWIMEAGAKVKIIDLDLKDVGMLKKWYDLDEAIWRYWLDTHAVRGTSTSDEEDEPERTTTNSENGPSPTLRLSPSSLSAVDGSSTRAMFVPSQSASGQVTSTQPSTREASIDLTPETVRQTPMDAAAISPAKWSPEELAEGAPSAAAGGLSPEDALTATPSYLRDETDAASHAPVDGMAGKVTSDGTIAPGNGLSFPPTRSESPSAERKKRSLAPSPSPTPFEKRLPDEDATPTPILALDNASNNAATESPHSVDLGGAAVTHVATSLGAGAVDLAEGVDNADMDNAESVANGVVNDAAARPLPKAMGMLRGDSERTESTGTGTSGISAPVEDFFTPAADIPEPLLASVGVSSPETLAGAAKSTDGVKAIANRDSDDSDVPEGSDDTFGPGQSIPGMVDAQATPPSDSVLLSAPMKAAVQTMDSDQAIIPSSTSSASELVPDLADGHQVGHAGNNAADRQPADLGREDTLPSITAPEEHEAESEPSKYSQSSAVTTRAGSLQVDDHDSFDQAGDGLAEIRRPEDDDQPRGEA